MEVAWTILEGLEVYRGSEVCDGCLYPYVRGRKDEHAGSPPSTFVGLGKRGKPAEAVADEAVDELLAFEDVADGAIDPHSADQVLIPLALAQGPSRYTVSEVTEHLRTNVTTIRAFLDRTIEVEEPGPGRPGRVSLS